MPERVSVLKESKKALLFVFNRVLQINLNFISAEGCRVAEGAGTSVATGSPNYLASVQW